MDIQVAASELLREAGGDFLAAVGRLEDTSVKPEYTNG